MDSFSLIFTNLLDTDITTAEYIEFRSMQFESEKVVDKVKEDGETRAKQEVMFFCCFKPIYVGTLKTFKAVSNTTFQCI